MNITKEKRKEIRKLRRAGMSIGKIADLLFPRACLSGHSIRPVAKVCKGVKFCKKPAWLQSFR